MLSALDARPGRRPARADRPAEHHVQPGGRRHSDPARAPAGRRPRAPSASRQADSPRPEARLSRGRVLVRRGPSPPGPRASTSVQQRHRWLRDPDGGDKKFGDDQAGSLAALVAYYAFFSLFPLLLVFMTILGFVLQGDPSAAEIDRELGARAVPGHRQTSSRSTRSSGHASALVIGIVTSLLGGLGVTRRRAERVRPGLGGAVQGPAGLPAAHGCAGLALLGVARGPVPRRDGRVRPRHRRARRPARQGRRRSSLSLILNFALFLAAFRLLTSADVPTALPVARRRVRGRVRGRSSRSSAAIYINHVVPAREHTYGAVRARDRAARVAAPRRPDDAVRGRDQRRARPQAVPAQPVRPARRARRPETLTALAKVEERHDDEQIDVEFDAQTQLTRGASPATARALEQPVRRLAPGHRRAATSTGRPRPGSRCRASRCGASVTANSPPQHAGRRARPARARARRVRGRRTSPMTGSLAAPRGTRARPRPSRAPARSAASA